MYLIGLIALGYLIKRLMFTRLGSVVTLAILTPVVNHRLNQLDREGK